MLSTCSAHTLLGELCRFFGDIGYYLSWLDQRINVNEGVVATVLALIGIGMQNVEGARRIAGLGFLAIAAVIFGAAVLEGGSRTLRGNPPFVIEVPSLFRNVHGDSDNLIASDELGRNSIQLVSGALVDDTPHTYLARHCIRDPNALAQKLADDGEADDPKQVLFSALPSGGAGDWCFFSWNEKGQPLDHYEVYIAVPSDNGGKGKFARMDLRAEKPTHALVTNDYRKMRNSLLVSAGLTPPQQVSVP